MSRYAKIILPLPFDQVFDYIIPGDIAVQRGHLVRVPVAGRMAVGCIDAMTDTPSIAVEKIKTIASLFSPIPFSETFLVFLDWVAQYTMTPRGIIYKMAILTTEKPKRVSKVAAPVDDEPMSAVKHTLSSTQKAASAPLCHAVTEGLFQPFLLDGLTGSGKTEVYFEAIESAITSGLQTLVMLPEIALSPQWIDRFQKHFGERALVWHSDLTPKYRREAWEKVRSGEGQVVVGARSALFLPFHKLGLIVVDEEHESSYKQEEGVIYHARDMAVARTSIEKIPIVLVSATPSLETVMNVRWGKYQKLHLPNRHGGAALPTIQLVDRRIKDKQGSKKHTCLSGPLREAIAGALARGEQSLLFLNRRGYAPLMLCEACGERTACPHCSAWLVMHQKTQKLTCHHCGLEKPLVKDCVFCHGKDTMVPVGPGVERVEEEITKLFPDARIALMTSDALTSHAQLEDVVRRIEAREVDIIVGTQMVAKGHHFPYLTTVGIVDADLGLYGGDPRACERTYQLLHQVGGRSGRAAHAGRVYVQTFMPEHPLMQALQHHDRDAFMAQEIIQRETLGFPPFGRLASILITSRYEESLYQVAHMIRKAAPHHQDVELMGPAPAPFYRLRGRYRYRILLKSPKNFPLQKYIRHWLGDYKPKGDIRIQRDMDPYTFL